MSTLLRKKRILASLGAGVSLPFGGLVSITNLVSYWKLDEVSGTRVDSHGTNHLIPTNAPVGVAGKIGNGCDFEASSVQFLTCASNPTLNLSNTDFTFTGWMKPESLPAYSLVIFKDSDQLEIRTEGTVFKFLINGVSVTSGIVSVNNWVFFVVALNTLTDIGSIQLNNGTVNQSSTTQQPGFSAVPFVLGARSDASLSFDGLIDEVGLWRRVLTTQERTDLYNAGAGLTY